MPFTFPAGFPRPFGPYLLLSSFGRGGMGEVFLAKRHQLAGVDELCIVKTVRQDLGGDESYARRFLDEARVVVHLSHANICPVFDAGQVGSEYFMSMEYIAGLNLRDLLARVAKQEERTPTAVALHIGCEMLHALGYAHKRTHPVTGEPLRLVHRDVSPHNVMAGLQGNIKLIDFGLAESALKQEHTESHVVLGKLAYMAPEQARGVDVDARCDQFSACVLLYEMLSGDRYYGDMNQREIWAVAGQGTFTPRRWKDLDADLQRILRRGLMSEPDERYPSCDALRADLDAYRHKSQLVARRDEVQGFLRRYCDDRLDWERQMRAACAHLQAPDVNARSGADDDVTLLLWRDEATGSIVWRDDGGEVKSLPLSSAAGTEVVPRSPRRIEAGASSRRPWAFAAIAAALLCAIGAGAYWSTRTEAALNERSATVDVVVLPAAQAAAAAGTDDTRAQVAPVEVVAAPAPAEVGTVGEGAVAETASVDAAVNVPRVGKLPAKRRTHARRQQAPKVAVVEASAEPVVEAPSEAPDPAPAQPPAPPPAVADVRTATKRSLAESVSILGSCSKRCAGDARALANGLEERDFKGSKRGVIDFCVERCLSDG